MANEEEIDGSDFVGLDDEEISLEALEQRLQTLQEKKEQIQKRKQKEILAKVKQTEAELSSMQSSSAYASFVLYKDKCIDSIKQHCLGNNYYYVACSCSTSCSNWKNIETVWLLLHEIEGLKSAGCSCSRDNGCCQHVIAFLLTLASYEKTNVSRKTKSNKSDAYGNLKILNDEFEEINTQKEIAIRPLETPGTGIIKQREVYSGRFLLFLQKSKFSQKTPRNLPDIPDIITSSNDKKTTPGKTIEDEKPESVPSEIMSTEDVMKRVISAINTLKHGGDTKMVVDEISDLPINTEDSLTRMVSLVVDTVAEDPSLTSTCCNICRVLARIKLPKGDDSNQLVTFSSVYGEKSEREIEYGIMSRPTESYRKRVEEIARFTGSIARHTLLKNADIHDILMKLSQSNLESFCILLTDVRNRMEKYKSEDYIDFYYGVIDAELSSNDHPTSLKYKLLQLKNKRR